MTSCAGNTDAGRCGLGRDEALYNRHLLFDNVIDPFKAAPREQFEATARSLRDTIGSRTVMTV